MNGLELAGFVIRSEYRKKVFLMLEKPVRPSEIAKSLSIRLTHVTRELRFLVSKKLVECVNPKERIGRIYRLTQTGIALKHELQKNNLL